MVVLSMKKECCSLSLAINPVQSMGVGTGVATGARALPFFELTFHTCSSERDPTQLICMLTHTLTNSQS